MKKDERKFEEVIETIKNAEIDVDRLLEAARLQRQEEQSRRLSAEQKMTIILCLIGMLTILCFFGFMLLGSIVRG